MNKTRAALPIFLFLALLLAALLPRTAALDQFVTADEHKWITRSANFAYALGHGDWIHTYQREHPAVTTTWLGALGLITVLPEYAATAPGYFNPDVEDWEHWLRANTQVDPLTVLKWGRIWTVLVVALVLALTFFPLRRLFGTLSAAVAVLFVAWSPMAIAYSRQVQPDGLHSFFMYAAFVFFLSWLYGGLHRRNLLLSGMLMGLGWLTKTPVLFLVPIGGLLVLAEWWRQRRLMTDRLLLRSLLGGYVLWGAIAGLVFFLLWPALWLDPIGIFGKMYREMSAYIGGHVNPNYFMGQVTQDPGPLFYPVAIFFRTTPAVLLGVVTAVIVLLAQSRHKDRPSAAWPPLDAPARRRALWGLLAFALFFTLFMTLPAKKFDRYLLPTFLILDTIAGLGWAALAMRAGRIFSDAAKASRKPLLAVLAVTVLGLLPLHALLNLPNYPYYLTYFNPLARGSRTAPDVLFVGWGEGLDEAGRWLSRQPDAEKKRAVAWYAGGPLSYYFAGESVGVISGSRMPWLDVDYVVTYINQVQRNIPTKEAIDFFARQTPVFTATISGMDMAKVYDMRAIVAKLYQEVASPVDIPAGLAWPPMTLTTLRTLPQAPPGSVLPVELAWQGPIDGTRRLSLRLIAQDGTLVAQVDDGLEVLNTIRMFVPPDAVPGDYGLHLMVYDAASLDPIFSADGQPIVQVTTIMVEGN